MPESYALLSLFFSAFISSTLFPGGSEVLLLYLASQTDENLLMLWLVASIGNTFGGLTSWFLGYWLVRRFPSRGLNEQKHQRALASIRRWGSISLLFSWLPIIGDPLCFVAGWLKVSFLWSGVFIAVGKAMRYGFMLLLLQ
ncbi:MAG TPA: DedA family protein [Gammaproteobacteria bacterium]|nr:DedA family protein [Gammaproteobacteria bacterium]